MIGNGPSSGECQFFPPFSAASTQRQAGNSQGEIDADLAREGERLERDGMVRPAHKELAPGAHAK
jgi:hypothetical protein